MSAAPVRDENWRTIAIRLRGRLPASVLRAIVHCSVRANELRHGPATGVPPSAGKLQFVAVVYDNQGQAVNGKQENPVDKIALSAR